MCQTIIESHGATVLTCVKPSWQVIIGSRGMTWPRVTNKIREVERVVEIMVPHIVDHGIETTRPCLAIN